ncbi:hypothetical protein SAMN04489834_3173 [Microterricola viridarii]|uniref:Uncharacterized protein n=1 Tax=Microterricola viridarii TaxID=412690 RepID=A0A1H1YR58_9MICO|nr:hypothetical protein SAMN04489834_3173 [Microterricola viridarii]
MPIPGVLAGTPEARPIPACRQPAGRVARNERIETSHVERSRAVRVSMRRWRASSTSGRGAAKPAGRVARNERIETSHAERSRAVRVSIRPWRAYSTSGRGAAEPAGRVARNERIGTSHAERSRAVRVSIRRWRAYSTSGEGLRRTRWSSSEERAYRDLAPDTASRRVRVSIRPWRAYSTSGRGAPQNPLVEGACDRSHQRGGRQRLMRAGARPATPGGSASRSR